MTVKSIKRKSANLNKWGGIKMKIDTSLIEGYEEMSAEDKIKALEEFEMEDEKAKKSVTKANGEAAEWKRKYRALEQERAGEKTASETALEELQQEVAQLKKEKKESEHRASFLALGYSEELAKDSARALMAGDLEKFFELQKKHQEEYKKDIEKKAVLGMQTPAGGANAYFSLTEEEFKNMDFVERVKFKKANPEQYKKFTT